MTTYSYSLNFMNITFNVLLVIVSLILVAMFTELWWKKRKIRVAHLWPFRHSWTSASAPAWIAVFVFFCGMTHVVDIFAMLHMEVDYWGFLSKAAAIFAGIFAARDLSRQLPELVKLPEDVDNIVAESLILKARAGRLEALVHGRNF